MRSFRVHANLMANDLTNRKTPIFTLCSHFAKNQVTFQVPLTKVNFKSTKACKIQSTRRTVRIFKVHIITWIDAVKGRQKWYSTRYLIV